MSRSMQILHLTALIMLGVFIAQLAVSGLILYYISQMQSFSSLESVLPRGESDLRFVYFKDALYAALCSGVVALTVIYYVIYENSPDGGE